MEASNKEIYGFDLNQTVYHQNNEAYITSLFKNNWQKYATIVYALFSEDLSDTGDCETFTTVNVRHLIESYLNSDNAYIEAEKILDNARKLVREETLKTINSNKDRIAELKSEIFNHEQSLKAITNGKYTGLENYYKMLNNEFKYFVLLTTNTPEKLYSKKDKTIVIEPMLIYTLEELENYYRGNSGSSSTFTFTQTNVKLPSDNSAYPRQYITMSLTDEYGSTRYEVEGFDSLDMAIARFNKFVSTTYINQPIINTAKKYKIENKLIDKYIETRARQEADRKKAELDQLNNKKMKLEQELEQLKWLREITKRI